MTTLSFVEKIQKIAKRYEELAGKPFQARTIGEGPYDGRINILKTIGKELKISYQATRDYINFAQLPEDAIEDIKQGAPWTYYLYAARAPMAIQGLIVQKIKNKEFKNREAVQEFVREYIKTHKETIPPIVEEKGEELMKKENKEINWSAIIRQELLEKGQVDIAELSTRKFGNDNKINSSRICALIYTLKRSFETKTGKRILKQDGSFILKEGVSLDNPEPVETGKRSKTAVLIVRETKENGTIQYEIDVVGEFNRNMLKEAMKQLMETLI